MLETDARDFVFVYENVRLADGIVLPFFDIRVGGTRANTLVHAVALVDCHCLDPFGNVMIVTKPLAFDFREVSSGSLIADMQTFHYFLPVSRTGIGDRKNIYS